MSVEAARAPRLVMVVNNAAFFLSHRAAVALAARDAGFDVHIVTPDGPTTAAVRELGFAWHPIALHRSSRAPWRELGTISDLVQLYRRLQPDIVHHVTPKPVLYGTIAARFAGTPAVVNAISGMGHVFAHNGDGMQILRGAVSAGYHLALRHKRMRLIFQNVDARADFLRRGWARADEAVLIRGSGVDVDAFRVAEPRPSRVPVVSLVSRMLWTKGVREFMEAAVQLRRDGVSARFVLVGDPDPGNPASVPGETLLDWARSGAVEWWGYRSDIPRVLRESDVACLPSYLEGLPKSLVEAAAAGLPIVATDVPGCREVVRDGENGFLVPLRDARALAAALRRLLEDRALRERLGATSRERAEREFTLDAVCEAHVQLYRALLD